MIIVVVFNSSMACFNDSRWLSITEAKAAKTSQKQNWPAHTKNNRNSRATRNSYYCRATGKGYNVRAVQIVSGPEN